MTFLQTTKKSILFCRLQTRLLIAKKPPMLLPKNMAMMKRLKVTSKVSGLCLTFRKLLCIFSCQKLEKNTISTNFTNQKKSISNKTDFGLFLLLGQFRQSKFCWRFMLRFFYKSHLQGFLKRGNLCFL